MILRVFSDYSFVVLRANILNKQQDKYYKEVRRFSLEDICRKFQKLDQNLFLNTNIHVEVIEIKEWVTMQAKETEVIAKHNL